MVVVVVVVRLLALSSLLAGNFLLLVVPSSWSLASVCIAHPAILFTVQVPQSAARWMSVRKGENEHQARPDEPKRSVCITSQNLHENMGDRDRDGGQHCASLGS